jgi:hypothetical protein
MASIILASSHSLTRIVQLARLVARKAEWLVHRNYFGQLSNNFAASYLTNSRPLVVITTCRTDGAVTSAPQMRKGKCEVTHGNHPRSICVSRILQSLAVPQQPSKLLETLETRVLKSLMLVSAAVI